MHSGDNKEASPYTAIKSNDVMDFLGNPTNYVFESFEKPTCHHFRIFDLIRGDVGETESHFVNKALNVSHLVALKGNVVQVDCR